MHWCFFNKYENAKTEQKVLQDLRTKPKSNVKRFKIAIWMDNRTIIINRIRVECTKYEKYL